MNILPLGIQREKLCFKLGVNDHVHPILTLVVFYTYRISCALYERRQHVERLVTAALKLWLLL